MSKRNSRITSFFQKKNKPDNTTEASSSTSIAAESDTEQSESTDDDASSETVAGPSGTSRADLLTTIECDIGKLLHNGVSIKDDLSRDDKYRLLTTDPDRNPLSYPQSRPCPSGGLRRFKPEWLIRYSWMHYSKFSDGVFCRACVTFSHSQAGGQNLGKFVCEPFRNWTKTSERATDHAKRPYHRNAIADMAEFIARYENPTEAIDVAMSNRLSQRMEANVKVVETLLRIAILCGKQGLALRGHRDDKINWDTTESYNEGNFIELVRFRAETDENLAFHLKNAPRNALYTSKTIQNELLSVIGDAIQDSIVREVKKARYYCVIADEVTDAANREEVSLVLRYLLDESVMEVFVDFIEVERITGRVIGESILNWLRTYQISLTDMRGQCYDGASNMSGARSGVKAVILEAAPKAVYYHCASHRLNLAIVSSCKIQQIKNCESCIGEIARYFSNSAKRQRLLDRAIEASDDAIAAKKVKDACRTRWVERIDSYAVFNELLPAVHMTLEAITQPHLHEDLGTDWNWDGESITKANGFLYQLQSSSFLLSFQILLQVLQLLREVTLKLQMKAIDVISAYQLIKTAVTALNSLRKDSETEFRRLFHAALKIGKELHGEEFELKSPRTSQRQRNRSNPPSSSSEQYFRISLYNEFLSHVVAELEDRFLDNVHSNSIGLLHLLPSKCVGTTDQSIPDDLAAAVSYYKDDLPHSLMFNTEYYQWVRHWTQQSAELPDSLVDSLRSCSPLAYPNLYALLRLAVTLPITSAESERSFSQLKLIKTARRTVMSGSRLSPLALMKIHRERCDQLLSDENMKMLVSMFAQRHPRRLRLPCMLNDE